MRCWGRNHQGQLGDGTTTNRGAPVDVVGLTGVVALAAGAAHTCGVTAAGAAWCWGDNLVGQLGDGGTADRSTPTAVADLGTGVVGITATDEATCALLADGTVRCWGRDSTPVYRDVGAIPKLGAGVLGNGSLGSSRTPTEVVGLPAGVDQLAAGSFHVCARADGGVWCWGDNSLRQLGDGTTTDRTTAVAVPGAASGVSSLHADASTTCVVEGPGSALRCWGDRAAEVNGAGLAGVASVAIRGGWTTTGSAPCGTTPPGFPGARTCSPLTRSTTNVGYCAALIGGGTRRWGAQLTGDASDATRAAPVAVTPPTGGAAGIAAGWNHTCDVGEAGGVRCWGDNATGQLGNGLAANVTPPAAVSAGAVTGLHRDEYGVDGSPSCTTSPAGAVRCWGRNDDGELGDGSTVARWTPGPVPGLAGGVQEVAPMDGAACALTAAGGVRCWGDNTWGQLGDGSTTDRPTRVEVVGLGSGVVALSATAWQACALTDAGAVRCWGRHRTAVGDLIRTTPWEPPGLGAGVVEVITTGNTACAVLLDRTVRCWGANGDGQVGDGTTTTRSSPVAVVGLTGIASLHAFGATFCARGQDASVRCWGDNVDGKVGDGTTTDRSTPTLVAGLAATSVDVGLRHACAITTGADLRCWGEGSLGQLGDGTGIDRRTPVAVVGLPSGGVTSVDAGWNQTCAVLTDATARCWGSNEVGEVGTGSTTPLAVTSPVAPAGLPSPVTELALANDTSCAVAAGEAWCWGAHVPSSGVGRSRWEPSGVPGAWHATTTAAPTILTPPDPTTAVTTGGVATVSASATGAPLPSSARWERSDDGGASWAALPGGTFQTGVEQVVATIDVPVDEVDHGALLRVAFTSSAGEVTSPASALEVLLPPVITRQPATTPSGQGWEEVVVAPGADLEVEVEVAGRPAPTVTWTRTALVPCAEPGGECPATSIIGTGTRLTLPAALLPLTGFVAAVASNPAGEVASTSFAVRVADAAPEPTVGQSISFPPLDPPPPGGSVALVATASSGLPVGFTTEGPCSVVGGWLHASAVGRCTVRADQAGGATHLPAPTVKQVLVIGAEQVITLGAPPASAAVGTRFTARATASSGRRVLFTAEGGCTASGSRIDITAVGTCTITAHQPGDLFWAPAEPVSATVSTTPGTNRISFSLAGPTPLEPGGVLTVRASTTSGAPPRFTASGPCALDPTTTPPTATATGPGTCTITAHHDGDDQWLPATPVARTATVVAPPA